MTLSNRNQLAALSYARYYYDKYVESKEPIKKVIFNDPATIVFWSDGTKTVVKCHDEEFDPEKGLAMAISKKALGNQGNYFNVFKKWTEPYYEKTDTETPDVESLYPSLTLEKAFENLKENMRRAFENKE